ncbi:hypothetical protein CAPTEDRAFT_186688 [Capitella teleta]|uniref:Ras-associating domain-containing protein n=1 Tax=Capitella teleta TaxID=283909 RepID=R7TYC3_CAPTE|nr:hypothetical protein CAPTEDRAFT_186688 [Capitella teleta]|eukprot:ELT95965.1 hypothetical protein CAPTEDRAFT_186688 [Capitella teleta]
MNVSDEEPEVPVWFQGTQKWITGLTRRTTCDDVIYAVLCDFCSKHVGVSEYLIWERWRGVERPLRGRTKVLKLWAAWDKMTSNVQLVIRRVESVVDSSSEVSTRRVKRRKSRRRRREEEEEEEEGITTEFKENRMTYLAKVVAEREGLIQKQEHRVQMIDEDIAQHEDRIHHLRMRRKGSNYLQEAYLRTGEESGSTASSNDDYQITEYSKQLEAYLELSAKVLAVQDQLEKAQQRAAELSELIAQEAGKEDLEEELKKADDLHEKQGKELSVLDESIKECDETLSKQERFFADLTEEPDCDDIPLAKDEPKTLRTVEDFEPYRTYMTYYRRKEDDGVIKGQQDDSNSDTGLSSLHSDEGSPVLETLV